jgi:hypothetical protein
MFTSARASASTREASSVTTTISRARRHRLAQLQAVALLPPGQRPWYPEAQVTRVTEATPAPAEVVNERGLLRRELGTIVGIR